jgi:hypothetical protein
MPTLTYGITLGDVVKSEHSREQCREWGTILGGAKYVVGTVLAMRTSDSMLVPAVNTAADGTQNAVGILLDNVDATGGNTKVVYLARGPATLSTNALTWEATVNDATKRAAKLLQLRALGIVNRTTA